jgi:hypothetical protein
MNIHKFYTKMMYQKILKLIMSVILLQFISSCAVYGTSFECKGGQGERCTSVSKINTMIDRGEIRDEPPVASPTKLVRSKTAGKAKQRKMRSRISKKAKVQRKQTDFDIWLAGTKEAEEKYIN